MKTPHISIIFIYLGSINIIYAEVETWYRIYMMRYGGICKIGRSCGGFPIDNPSLVGLGVILIGIWYLFARFINEEKIL